MKHGHSNRGVVLMGLVVLLVNLLGDALLTYFDPKKRKY